MIEFLLMAVLIPTNLPSLSQSGKISTDVYKYIFEHLILSIVDNDGRNLIGSFHIVV